MSSNGGNRKSMDDVLSSIRRIIGAEKKDGYDDQPDQDIPPPPPLTLGTPIAGGTGVPMGGAADKPAEPAGDALSLTPNMRVDFTRLTADKPADPIPQASDMFAPPPAAKSSLNSASHLAAPDAADHDTAEYDEDDEDAVVIDEAALEEMIRRVVREELEAREQAALAQMRHVVRDELAGDIGKNISRNVQSLIQSEVARLMRARD